VKHGVEDTIAAIATPMGVGGVGVIRISGQMARPVLYDLFIPSNGSSSDSHHMVHGWLIDPATRDRIDEIMACYMGAPKTFTGEDVVELYCHGGVAVLQKALSLVLDAGARLAHRGEFTKRAFLNGKLDLSQAEAILDLVRSQTAAGAGLAVRQLEGRLSKTLEGARTGLVVLLAELEAQIDFSDDLPELNYKALGGRIQRWVKGIGALLAGAEPARLYREGVVTAIVGKPNVGKSSLLNALLGEERAIVTREAGTTRDSIEESINVEGVPFRVIDTAGIRHPKNRVEKFGVERAQGELAAADFVLIILDGSRPLGSMDRRVLKLAGGRPGVVVLNKMDLGSRLKFGAVRGLAGGMKTCRVSALYGDGLVELKKTMAVEAGIKLGGVGKDAVSINARHRQCLSRAIECMLGAAKSIKKGLPVDFITIDVKGAIVALGEVTGEQVSEEVINSIFDRFCIGK